MSCQEDEQLEVSRPSEYKINLVIILSLKLTMANGYFRSISSSIICCAECKKKTLASLRFYNFVFSSPAQSELILNEKLSFNLKCILLIQSEF